jgi:4-amino-4-deoxy-L-arabinose transferase-like glycosyltransferase
VQRGGQGRLVLALFLLILLLAFVLRLYGLDAQSLWNDEGSSVALAQRDLGTIARDAAQDIHPPLYYWLLSGWVRLFGTSEVAVRSLSAFLGVGLVALTFVLGRLLAGRWAGLVAALLAAIHPFQVYYSQEARMYALLAVLSALTFYAALAWAAADVGRTTRVWAALYVLAAAAGLYTHYAFPMVLVAVNLVLLVFIAGQWVADRRPGLVQEAGPAQPWLAWLWRWVVLQVVVVLLFLPWLPAAYRQLTTWPQVAASVNLNAALVEISQLFAVGPAAPPWLAALVALVVLLVVVYPPGKKGRLPVLVIYLAPVLWLIVPVVLILALGLYKEAYLKFLLVASPAFCLLAGRFVAAPLRRGRRAVVLAQSVLAVFVAVFLAGASVYGLVHYYTDPAYARDDYRGIARYIEAVGRPGDVVVLNAPGQQEVFGYYYDGPLPVHPLPEDRPLDPAATEAALEALAQPAGRVYAVLWATDESDPDRVIEGWLDTHTYKALDSWFGNVRLVVYAVPQQAPDSPDRDLDVRLRHQASGDEIRLVGYSLLEERLAAGDIAPLTLFWQVDQTPSQRYKVFVHLLDPGNHIVGQRDAEPGGGARLTTLWSPGETIVDNYGLPIHPGTPPGVYRIEVGLYDPATGERLTQPDGAGQVWLEPLVVERPDAPAPIAALGIQHPAGVQFGELSLLGYDAYRLGFEHQPDAPVRPGDVLHLALYWRAEAQPVGRWRTSIALVDSDDQAWGRFEAEPTPGYPTDQWQAGDVWRGQFNLPVPDDLPPGRYWLQIQPVSPRGAPSDAYRAGPLSIGQ